MSAPGALSARLNWLRAGVLGANDGIISIAGLVVGVAAATSDRSDVATAGIAGLAAGAVSMALGEYVSVSAQRDTEQAIIDQEVHDQAAMPQVEHEELIDVLRERGLSFDVAHAAVHQLEARDPIGEHLRIEYGIHREELANPWAAALSSALAFTLGALVPLIAVVVPPSTWRVPVTFVAVLIGLTVTGVVSARLSSTRAIRPVVRLTAGGAAAMAITFGVGHLLGTTLA